MRLRKRYVPGQLRAHDCNKLNDSYPPVSPLHGDSPGGVLSLIYELLSIILHVRDRQWRSGRKAALKTNLNVPSK